LAAANVINIGADIGALGAARPDAGVAADRLSGTRVAAGSKCPPCYWRDSVASWRIPAISST